MLDILANVFDEQDGIVSVLYALFDGDPKFITAIEFGFSSFNITFRANPDDALSAGLGSLEVDSDETRIEVSESKPWSLCKGSSIQWFWRLTNHQGYYDGVRMEFVRHGEKFRLFYSSL
jgi:hypothetical protein